MQSRGKPAQRLLQLALAALLLRALVPAGFMAAPLADGWPLQLCPSGMSMSSFMVLLDSRDHSDHHAHAAHSAEEPDPVCGLSAAYSAIALSLSVTLEPLWTVVDAVTPRQISAQPRAPPSAHRTRAPPALF